MKKLTFLLSLLLATAAFTSNLTAETPLDLIPNQLINATGETVDKNLDGKYVGIYFSAHWCAPCRLFSPELVKFRNSLKDEFEIVFVSSDKSAKKQLGYMQELNMEWVAVPWRSEEAKNLQKKFNVKSIPTLVIISPDGKVLTTSGRADIEALGLEALTTWKNSNNNT